MGKKGGGLLGLSFVNRGIPRRSVGRVGMPEYREVLAFYLWQFLDYEDLPTPGGPQMNTGQRVSINESMVSCALVGFMQ